MKIEMSSDILKRITIIYDKIEKYKGSIEDESIKRLLNDLCFYQDKDGYVFKPNIENLKSNINERGLKLDDKVLVANINIHRYTSDDNAKHILSFIKSVLPKDFETKFSHEGCIYEHYDIFVPKYLYKQAYELNGGDFDKDLFDIIRDTFNNHNY